MNTSGSFVTSRSVKSNFKTPFQKIIPIPDDILKELLIWMLKVLSDDRFKIKTLLAFSDGVVMAKIFAHYHPRLVNLNNYPSCYSNDKKLINWNLLNNRVLSKFKLRLNPKEIRDLAQMNPTCFETYLRVKKVLQPVGTNPPPAPYQVSRARNPAHDGRNTNAHKTTLQHRTISQPRSSENQISTVKKLLNAAKVQYRSVYAYQPRSNEKRVSTIKNVNATSKFNDDKNAPKPTPQVRSTYHPKPPSNEKRVSTISKAVYPPKVNDDTSNRKPILPAYKSRSNSRPIIKESVKRMEQKTPQKDVEMGRKKPEKTLAQNKSENILKIERMKSEKVMEKERKEPENAIEIARTKAVKAREVALMESEKVLEIERLMAEQRAYEDMIKLNKHIENMRNWIFSAYKSNLVKVYEIDEKLYGIPGRLRSCPQLQLTATEIKDAIKQLRGRKNC